MKNFRRIYIILLGILILLSTVSFAKTGIVDAPNGLVFRKEASKTAEPLATISDKAEVEIIEKSGEWYKVKYNNEEGYLYAEYVTEKEEAPAVDTETTTTPVEPTNAEETNSDEVNTAIEESYPKDVALTANLKIYIIPSITSSIINTIESGKTVTINKKVNDWVYITFEGKTGWTRNNLITGQTQEVVNEAPVEETPTEETPQETTSQETTPVQTKKGYINVSSSANLRETASTSSNVLTTLTTNTEITITGEEGTWYKVTYKEYNGYISKELISNTPIEVTSRSQTTARKQVEVTSQVEANSASGDAIVAFAKQYLGYDYVYGGTTPNGGFDCTGFTYYVYNNCGYSLSRSCSVQASSGTSVAKSELQPGDLLIFNNGGNGTIGHVGIYIGNGTFIHAANPRRGVVTDTINSGYYNTYYYDARRIV